MLCHTARKTVHHDKRHRVRRYRFADFQNFIVPLGSIAARSFTFKLTNLLLTLSARTISSDGPFGRRHEEFLFMDGEVLRRNQNSHHYDRRFGTRSSHRATGTSALGRSRCCGTAGNAGSKPLSAIWVSARLSRDGLRI